MKRENSYPNRSIIFTIALLCWALTPSLNALQISLKDLARFKGNRKHRLTGYGLVTGLNGTGDKNSLTAKMAKNFFRNMGMKDVTEKDVQSKNVAAVMVTAELNNFTRSGDTFDVTISSIGNSKSLRGGILLPTVLKGGDGNPYSQVQGPISMGGLDPAGKKNHETVARIINGAILEKDFPYDFFQYTKHLGLIVKKPDFTTTSRIVSVINTAFEKDIASAIDSAFIRISVPRVYQTHLVDFISLLENLKVTPSEKARVVINERTGTVVFGQTVKISPIVLSHGELQIEIGKEGEPSKKGSVIPLDTGENVATLVTSLNSLGTKPRDLIAILQALKLQGALKAELVIF